MSLDSGAELADLMQFLYACPIGLVGFSMDGTIDRMNPKAMQLLQSLTSAPFLANVFTAFEGCGPELRNLAQGFAAPRGTVCENHRVVVRRGSAEDPSDTKVLDCTLIKLSGERFIATFADVSRQVMQERRLRQAEAWFSSLLDGPEEFDIVSLDAEGRIDGIKPALLQEVGLDREAVVGRTLDVLDAEDPDEPRTEAAAHIALARRDGWYLDEGWQRRANGNRRWCQRLIVVRSETGVESGSAASGYIAVLRPTAQHRYDAAKLRRMLRTDHLTGACNRARFFELAEREIARRRQVSVIIMDVDHFKRINDTHGHAMGDDILKAIARACGAALPEDHVFARVGGEEFAVLLPCGLDGAVDTAEALRRVVADVAVPIPGGTLGVTASFGCATLAPATRSLTALLAEADVALYAAKRGGRDRVARSGDIASVA